MLVEKVKELPDISIHAPPRGATSCKFSKVLARNFNSRPSARGDAEGYFPAYPKLLIISIHAPPRGATELRIHDRRAASHFNSRPSARGDIITAQTSTRHLYFNSRPSARGDRLATTTCPLNGIFQFTPLREGRPRRVGSAERWLYHFNSRPSARGDLALVASTIGFGISIHAPPRGATTARLPPTP